MEETPDLLLDLHSCENGPFFISGDPALPESYTRRCHYLDGFVRRALWDRLGIAPMGGGSGREQALTFPSACYHVSGALPIVFEGPDGAHEGFRYNHEQIIDMYLLLFASLMTIGAHERFVPRPT